MGQSLKTLADAWSWYESARKNLQRMRRLGVRHWTDDSLRNASIWQDERFKQLEAGDIDRETEEALRPIEDLAIVVLFSVFEAVVRDYLESRIQPEAKTLTHPVLRQAADDAIEGVREGSFSLRILGPIQDQALIEPQLIEKVNQVRRYRNWVAHGKRGTRKKGVVNLNAKETYDRLKEFLNRLGIASESEIDESEGPREEFEGAG